MKDIKRIKIFHQFNFQTEFESRRQKQRKKVNNPRDISPWPFATSIGGPLRDHDLRSGSDEWSGFWSHWRWRLAITITMANPRGCIRSSCDLSTGFAGLRSRTDRCVPRDPIVQWLLLTFEKGLLKPCSCVYMFIDSSVPRQSQPRDFCAVFIAGRLSSVCSTL